ncbi:MAG: hypothetical protein ACOX3R_00225 [Desulfitobacteriia bacterium]
MFSTETSVLTVTRKQYLTKLKAFSFSGLIIMQVVILNLWDRRRRDVWLQ